MGRVCIKDHRPEHSLGDERWLNGCAQCEIEKLRAELAAVTADRDSWADQAAQRTQDALDLVAAERERWRAALGACDAALSQCQPCADPDCGAVQRDCIDTARAAAAKLLMA